MTVKKQKQKSSLMRGVNKIVEANDIARAELSPAVQSVWEERILAQITACIKQEDNMFTEISFLAGLLVDTKRVSSSQLIEIEKASSRLVATTFKVKKGKDFTIYSALSYIKYEDGILTAKFNSDLAKYYLELSSHFAIRSLPEFRRLSSVYSQQLFRFLNSWAGLPEVTVSLEELHRLTSPPPSVCEYKNFKPRILDVAHKEINEKTNLKYNWEPVRIGRKVTDIRFNFRKK